jgi:hypothetical protein
MKNYIPKVGDKVRIKKASNWNSDGCMDHFEGKEVTIKRIDYGNEYRFDGDESWTFRSDSFEPINQDLVTFKFC